uniref:Uncharacterized protein n=1 Tax=Globodera rostochiensis TaxID=31243 RepID=A0A914I403_GLORO
MCNKRFGHMKSSKWDVTGELCHSNRGHRQHLQGVQHQAQQRGEAHQNVPRTSQVVSNPGKHSAYTNQNMTIDCGKDVFINNVVFHELLNDAVIPPRPLLEAIEKPNAVGDLSEDSDIDIQELDLPC